MSSLDDMLSETQFSGFAIKNENEHKNIFFQGLNNIIDSHFNLGHTTESTCTSVKSYAEEVISLRLLYMEYIDSIREGDGDQILNCWKFMLLIFKASNKFMQFMQYAIITSCILKEWQTS